MVTKFSNQSHTHNLYRWPLQHAIASYSTGLDTLATVWEEREWETDSENYRLRHDSYNSSYNIMYTMQLLYLHVRDLANLNAVTTRTTAWNTLEYIWLQDVCLIIVSIHPHQAAMANYTSPHKPALRNQHSTIVQGTAHIPHHWPLNLHGHGKWNLYAYTWYLGNISINSNKSLPIATYGSALD